MTVPSLCGRAESRLSLPASAFTLYRGLAGIDDEKRRGEFDEKMTKMTRK